MRRIMLGTACCVAALGCAGVVGAPALGSPFVKVTPSKHLVNGEVVTVSGSDFVAGSEVLISECNGRTSEVWRVERFCDGETAQSLRVTSTGTIPPTPFAIYKGAFTEAGSTYECGDRPLNKTCFIGALDGNDIAYAPISLEIPELLVTPNTNLTNGEEVMVSGKNLLPNSQIDLYECVKEVGNAAPRFQAEHCTTEVLSSTITTGEGTFPPTPFTVRTGRIVSGNLSDTECGTSQRTQRCYVRAADPANDSNNDALGQITFVP